MPREQFQTLSEPMYYVLLSLVDECCGMDIMHRVQDISHGRVAVGPGTLYAMLDKFLKSGVITELPGDGRKRTYVISEKGCRLLFEEYRRLSVLSADGRAIIERKDERI